MTAAEFLQSLMGSATNGAYDIGAAGGALIVVEDDVNFRAVSQFDFKKRLSIRNVRFQGAVDFDNCEFGDNVNFRGCKFDHSLNLGKTDFGNGLSFADCVFGPDKAPIVSAITLDDAEIRGDLIFERVTVDGGCISAQRLQLAGNLEFTACTLKANRSFDYCAFDLSHGRVEGTIYFETGKLSPEAPSHRLRRSRYSAPGGNCIVLRGVEVTDLIRLAWARFEGGLDLSFVKCRGLHSMAGIFAGRKDETVENQIGIAKDECFRGARIDGPITLSGGEFGLIHLFGVHISREMMLIGGSSGQISIEDSIVGVGENNYFIATSQIGPFIMSRWHCRDFLVLHATKVVRKNNVSRVDGVTIKASTIDRAISFWPGDILEKQYLAAYLDSGSERTKCPNFFVIDADGSMVRAESGAIHRNLLNRWRRQLTIHGNISIDHCSIGDDLILTGVDLITGSKPEDGRIEVVDSKIDGNVIFRTPISFLADAQVDLPISRLLAQRLVVGAGQLQQNRLQSNSASDVLALREESFFVPALCHALDTGALRANKIDLTGLYVRKPFDQDVALGHPVGRKDESPPNAVMSNMEVNGKVATFARLGAKDLDAIFAKIKQLIPAPDDGAQPATSPNPQSKPIDRAWELLSMCFGTEAGSIDQPADKRVEASATIPGSLDLQHSKIAELLISDVSFREHSLDSKPADCGVVLDYAQISKLYVARSKIHDGVPRAHNGFPVPVSLLDLSVKTWFLESGEAETPLDTDAYIGRETTTAGPYLDLLENDPEFRMSSYLAVEKSLRDRGLTDEAGEIFIAASYRDVRTESVKKQPTTSSVPAQDGEVPWPNWHPKSWRNWKVWRRGDGRYRSSILVEAFQARDGKRDPSAVGLCALGCAMLAFVVLGIVIWPSPVSFGWFLPVALYFFALNGNIFRLQRPWREYFGFIISAALCAAILYFAAEMLLAPSLTEFAALMGLLLLVLLPLFAAARCFIDQLYWSLVDYGTSAVRLAGVIFVLMAISFAFVSRECKNFGPTLLAESLPSAQQTKWNNWDRCTPKDWSLGERLWMTFRFHVPLVGANISEEWQPADAPLIFGGMTRPNGSGSVSATWLDRHWPTARDWYALMLWTNWILWPLFLPFLIHKLSRER
jgi:hypothetical protein